MDTKCMTPKQLRELADKIEAESKVAKKGYLKGDLYKYKSQYKDFSGFLLNDNLKTEDEKQKLVNSFESHFELYLEKGSEFVCYVIEGKEYWYDSCGYVENMNSSWAEQHLEGITIVS